MKILYQGLPKLYCYRSGRLRPNKVEGARGEIFSLEIKSADIDVNVQGPLKPLKNAFKHCQFRDFEALHLVKLGSKSFLTYTRHCIHPEFF